MGASKVGATAWAGVLLGWLAVMCVEASTAHAQPQKMLAISSVNFGDPPGTPINTINFFDVTDIDSAGPGAFGNRPLFSVFIGLDEFEGFDSFGTPLGSEEDVATFTVNPVNGMLYAIAFDQLSDDLGPGGAVAHGDARASGDTAGDFDLLRIDYQAILKDFTTQNRVPGTIYAPRFTATTAAIEEALRDSGHPGFDGTVDGVQENVPHRDSLDFPDQIPTVHLDGAIVKIGELGRAATERDASFFNHQIEFIDPGRLLRLDGSTANTAEGDHEIRLYTRESKSPGLATGDLDGGGDLEGGYNGNTAESWRSDVLGRLELDPAITDQAIASSRTDVTDWALVNRDGVVGVWVAEFDGGGGDDLAFFEIDLDALTATKKDIAQLGGAVAPVLAMDEDPSVATGTNDGEIDQLFVDAQGNLVIVESGFNDTDPNGTGQTGRSGLPAQESRVITLTVDSYDGPDSDGNGAREVVTGAWSTPVEIDVTGFDDDTRVTDTRFAAYDRDTGYLYIIAGGDTNFTEDIYVFDPATGTVVYYEDDPTNPGILNKATQLIIQRGDVNDDGRVDASDVAMLQALLADPTRGGEISAELADEWYDLTGDGLLTSADLTELTEGILGGVATPGDVNLDGVVDGADLAEIEAGLGVVFGGGDLLAWQRSFGQGMSAESNATSVPEPCGAAWFVVATWAGCRRRRR